MEHLNMLPPDYTLGATRPRPHDGNKKILILAQQSSATGVMGKKTFFTHGKSFLVFESINAHRIPDHQLLIAAGDRLPGQTLETQRSIVATCVKKGPEHISFDREVPYDMRSIAYVTGFIWGRCAMEQNVQFSSKRATVVPIEQSYYAVRPGDLIITSNMYKTGLELATLLQFLPMCGVDRVRLAAPGPISIPMYILNGADLGVYCMRLLDSIMCSANEVGTAPHHLRAMYSGMMAAVKLRAHNDEGGYIRDVMSSYTCPTPSGVVGPVTTSLLGFDHTHYSKVNLRKDFLAHYLSGVCCVVAADPGLKVDGKELPAMLIGKPKTNARPSDWNGLDKLTEEWYMELIRKIAVYHNMPVPEFFDAFTLNQFFVNDTHNRHLSGAGGVITPFAWVEASSVCTEEVGPKYFYVPMLKSRTIPLWNGRAVALAPYSVSDDGTLLPGSRLHLTTENTSYRDHGVSYICGSMWNREDGLANFTYEALSAVGGMAMKPGFIAADAKNMAEGHWRCWDNCMPHPLNGYSSTGLTGTFYTSTLPKTGMKVEDVNNPVVISSGIYTVFDPDQYHPEANSRNAKYVPSRVIAALLKHNPYDNSSVQSQGDDYTRLVAAYGASVFNGDAATLDGMVMTAAMQELNGEEREMRDLLTQDIEETTQLGTQQAYGEGELLKPKRETVSLAKRTEHTVIVETDPDEAAYVDEFDQDYDNAMADMLGEPRTDLAAERGGDAPKPEGYEEPKEKGVKALRSVIAAANAEGITSLPPSAAADADAAVDTEVADRQAAGAKEEVSAEERLKRFVEEQKANTERIKALREAGLAKLPTPDVPKLTDEQVSDVFKQINTISRKGNMAGQFGIPQVAMVETADLGRLGSLAVGTTLPTNKKQADSINNLIMNRVSLAPREAIAFASAAPIEDVVAFTKAFGKEMAIASRTFRNSVVTEEGIRTGLVKLAGTLADNSPMLQRMKEEGSKLLTPSTQVAASGQPETGATNV